MILESEKELIMGSVLIFHKGNGYRRILLCVIEYHDVQTYRGFRNRDATLIQHVVLENEKKPTESTNKNICNCEARFISFEITTCFLETKA